MLVLAVLQLLVAILATASPVRQHDEPEKERFYLVKFKDHASHDTIDAHIAWLRNLTRSKPDGELTFGLRHRFGLAFQGYSALLDENALEYIFTRPEVVSIDPIGYSDGPEDNPATSFDESDDLKAKSRYVVSDDRPVNRARGSLLYETVNDRNKGWNANRLSHRQFPMGYKTGVWTHNGFLGQGATVYVLDTGVNLLQPGFAGSTVIQPRNFVRASTGQDINGHGTMCAGVIAGREFGLAPEARLVSLKVANDDNVAWADDVVAGIEYAVEDETVKGGNSMKVISLSQVNFSGTPIVNRAVEAAIAAGVHVVISAGNDNVDACSVSPANSPNSVVVGSINAWNALPVKGSYPDTRTGIPLRTPVGVSMGVIGRGTNKSPNPSFAAVAAEQAAAQEAFDLRGFNTPDPEGTNWGRCVTLFAPGIYVPTLSTHNLSSAYHYWGWGTSIAAPQVAALIAARLSQIGPVQPLTMKKWLINMATPNQIRGPVKGSPNLIAFSGIGVVNPGEGPTGVQAPFYPPTQPVILPPQPVQTPSSDQQYYPDDEDSTQDDAAAPEYVQPPQYMQPAALQPRPQVQPAPRPALAPQPQQAIPYTKPTSPLYQAQPRPAQQQVPRPLAQPMPRPAAQPVAWQAPRPVAPVAPRPVTTYAPAGAPVYVPEVDGDGSQEGAEAAGVAGAESVSAGDSWTGERRVGLE